MQQYRLLALVLMVSMAITSGCEAEREVTIYWDRDKVNRELRALAPPDVPTGLPGSGRAIVVYADLRIASTGRVDEVMLPSTTDAAISDAIRKAAATWTFPTVRSAADNRPVRGLASVRFTFDLANRTVTLGRPDSIGSTAPPVKKYSAGLQSATRLPGPLFMIDLRSRAEFRADPKPTFFNIPADELARRIPTEIPPGTTAVLDCPTSMALACEAAAETLVANNRSVVVLQGGV